MDYLDRHINVKAYAKINLSLDILDREENGYHKLQSVMQTIELHDLIGVASGEPGIRLICNDKKIPSDKRNLAFKAAEKFFSATGIYPAADISIEKHIPVEAGLGGGSSDAAAVMVALNKLMGEPLTVDELYAESASIGSDVPFFITGGTAFVSDFGENVRPIADIPETFLLIVKPDFGISTAWAYNRLDEIRLQNCSSQCDDPKTPDMIECICSAKWSDIPKHMFNDLELPSIERYPVISSIKNDMMQSGAAGSLMCGSGSAIYAVYEDIYSMERAKEYLGKYGRIFITHTVKSLRII